MASFSEKLIDDVIGFPHDLLLLEELSSHHSNFCVVFFYTMNYICRQIINVTHCVVVLCKVSVMIKRLTEDGDPGLVQYLINQLIGRFAHHQRWSRRQM